MVSTESLNRALRRVPVLPLYFLALAPGLYTFYLALNGRLGADPMRALEHGLGIWALRFAIATLCVTPLRRYSGVSLLRFRRCLGLSAFYYALAHLAVYLFLDRQLAWGEILADLTKRPYIIFGMLAFIAIVPLALTSTDLAVRRLGAAAWTRLHMLFYPAAMLMVLHYLMLVKTWTAEPLIYAAIMTGLLALRVSRWQQNWRRRRAARV